VKPLPRHLQILVAVACGAAAVLLPEAYQRIIPYAVVGLLLLVLLAFLLIYILWQWQLHHPRSEPQPPPPPMPCPRCACTEHDYKVGGFWDGVKDPVSGVRPGGTFGYGVCKRCGARWGQWDQAPPYVAAVDEWNREVEGPEAKRAEQLRLWTEHHAKRAETASTNKTDHS
jgi:hypothetical protein